MSAPPPRKNRFLGMLPSLPVSKEALRKLLLKATVTGLSALSLGSTSPVFANTTVDTVVPTIENRNRRGFAKLVLRMRGPNGRLLASHGSHSSHSSHASHASHYSSSGGSRTISEPSTPAPPTASPSTPTSEQETRTTQGAIDHATRITITGIDTEERKITGKNAAHQELVFYYTPTVKIRRRASTSATPLDKLTRNHPEELPFKWGSKVTVTWTSDPDGRKNVIDLALD